MNDLASLALTELAAKAAVDHPTMTRSELERIVLEELMLRKQTELENDAKAMKAAQALLDKRRADEAKRAAEAARQAEVETARVAAEQRAREAETQARREALTASHAASVDAYRAAVSSMAEAACAWLRAYHAIDTASSKVSQSVVDAYEIAGVEGLAQPGWHDCTAALTEALRALRGEVHPDVWTRAVRDIENARVRA